jgi:FkbM family methyltransferase
MKGNFRNPIDRWLSSGARGTARLNVLFRGLWPINLIQCKIDYGILLHLDPQNYVDCECIRTGFYEKEVLSTIISDIREGDVFWDIGANIGIMSIAIAKLYPASKVIAFECNPLTTHRLCTNIQQNQVEIKVFNVALSNQNKISTFSIRNTGNSGISSLTPWVNATYENEISVATRTADSLIETNEASAPTLIKIDVEGHELEVLLGLSKHLGSEALRTIVFEAADPESLGRLTALLADKGYSVAPILSELTLTPTNHVARRPNS